MNRITTLILAAVCTLTAYAQLNGDGYYRAQSTEQGRYITVVDNRGSVNLATTDADMGALCTRASFENVVSDPASIIYIKKMSSGYDFQSQGTGSYSIISYEIKLADWGGTYWCYASHAGMTKYLADQVINYELLPYLSEEEKEEYLNNGQLVTNVSPGTAYEKYLDWNINPVIDAEGFYFGLQPGIAAGDSYYQTFYADFPFTFSSEGMTAYYVSEIREATGKVIIEEITGGVPSATPVLIKCSSQNAANNKLNVGASTSGSAAGNKLTGVYFCNPDAGSHTNVVAFDPTTMRVLGKAEDGSLAFINNVELAYIPANTAYITVSPSAPAILKVVTADQADGITLKADDLQMVYGDNVPSLTYSILEGAPEGEPALSCEASSTSPVGTYPIKMTKGTLTNKNISLQDGTLTIVKAPLTITAMSYTITQGDALPEYAMTYLGFKNNETEEELTTKPTITCEATAASAPGIYDIIVSGAEAKNYDFVYENGKLTIVEASAIQTVTSDNKRGDVYDMSGRRIRENATTLEGLSKGVYILNGRIIVKQ